MPRPTGSSTRYVPALDGVRALAVVVVVGYHLGLPWLPGGLLGVGVFFSLSGYLITSLLLEGWRRDGGMGLRGFWVRRARRLLPAVVTMLAVVLAVTAIVDPAALGERAVQAAGALLYVSNWQTIAAGESYFQRVTGPGPLDHLWSLAVEEQFYVVWPLLLLALVVLCQGRLTAVARVTATLAGISFVLMGVLATRGLDNTRAYEGTDTRAGALLLGAAVALVWRPATWPPVRRLRERVALDSLGLAGLCVVVLLVATVDEYSFFLYRGGIFLLSTATVILVAVVCHPSSLLARPFGIAPMRWVGERSYGIYLWHLPVIAFTPASLLVDAPVLRGSFQVVLVLSLAALSWSFVEDPIRRRGFVASLRVGRTALGGRAREVPAALAGVLAVLLVGTTALSATAFVGGGEPRVSAVADPDKPPLPPDAAAHGADLDPKRTTRPTAVTGTASAPRPSARRSAPATNDPAREPATDRTTSTPGPRASTSSTVGPPVGRAGRTSCTQLVHVGDSTSVGLVDPAYLPDASKRLPAQYRRIGISDFTPDILGARSIVERYRGQPNAQEAVTSRTADGYDGCWVLAMGTNEVANQYVGGTVPLAARIDDLMRSIGERPVLWLTVRTLRATGPWGEDQMARWNAALRDACDRYPAMRVYDWAAEVRDSWFVDDDIHFTSRGYAERARRTADAFASAFPSSGSASGGPGSSCVIRSGDR